MISSMLLWLSELNYCSYWCIQILLFSNSYKKGVSWPKLATLNLNFNIGLCEIH